MVQNFTDDNFQEEVLDAKGIVLVDFWASWCGPCRVLAPTIDELAAKYESDDNVKIGKYSTDDNTTYASKYNVMSIPCVKFFKDGELKDEIVGLRDADAYIDKIEELLA